MSRIAKLLFIIAALAFIFGIICVSILTSVMYELAEISQEIARIEQAEVNYIPEEKNPEKTAIEQPKTILIENVKLTAYCKEPYVHRCNDGDASNTATMTTPTVGRTVAVDPKIIPFGSRVTINDKTYIAEDTGESIKGNRIDILFETHQEALNFGVQYADVIVEV